MKPKLKINLFGEGQSLHRVNLTAAQNTNFQKLASELRLPLPQALIDPFFYHKLRNQRITSFTDLDCTTIYAGLSDTRKNQIEIWHSGKKVLKLKINDLTEWRLFELYQTTIKPITTEFPGLYILQKEIGLIGCYEMNCDHFAIDQLNFQLIIANDIKLLEILEYNGQHIKLKKKDTLLQTQVGYQLD